MIDENINRNLEQVDKIKGKVKNTYIISKRERLDVKPFTKVNVNLFVVELTTSKEKFIIHIPSQDYSTIQNKLKRDDEIIIHYFMSNSSKLSSNVYQIENKGEIIVDHENYKMNHIILGVVLLIFGLSMFGMCVWYIKTKEFKNWG